MGLFTGLYAGRESLVTHGTALSTVADNIANVSTPGFKSERVEFGDLFAGSVGNLYGEPLSSGNGVRATDITAGHRIQGTFEPTGRDLDFGIQGNGFFVMSDAGANVYSRAGNFFLDSTGNIVNSAGDTLMGFTTASPTTAVALNVSSVTGAATPTTTAAVTGNLSAAAPIATATTGTTFAQLNANSQFHTSIEVKDSLGESHDIALHFFKTGNGAWTVNAFVSSTDTTASTPGTVTVGTPQAAGSASLTFDATGKQAAGATSSLPISVGTWANGAAGSTVALDLTGFTGFASASALNSATADGSAAGQVTGYELDSKGTLLATLDNGQKTTVGTVVLANFNNPDGLKRVGDNRFSETDDSGTATIGAPDAEGRGQTASGVLEGSTVDETSELINMVRYQRAYQAGSKIISAINEVLQTTIQMA